MGCSFSLLVCALASVALGCGGSGSAAGGAPEGGGGGGAPAGTGGAPEGGGSGGASCPSDDIDIVPWGGDCECSCADSNTVSEECFCAHPAVISNGTKCGDVPGYAAMLANVCSSGGYVYPPGEGCDVIGVVIPWEYLEDAYFYDAATGAHVGTQFSTDVPICVGGTQRIGWGLGPSCEPCNPCVGGGTVRFPPCAR